MIAALKSLKVPFPSNTAHRAFDVNGASSFEIPMSILYYTNNIACSELRACEEGRFLRGCTFTCEYVGGRIRIFPCDIEW